MMKFPEILAPGGDTDSVKAAILAGADAVYLGLSKFNARRRAVNIEEGDLSDLVLLAHARGVRLYVTINVLLTTSEIEAALSMADASLDAGIDGFIVQDIGLFYLLSLLFPDTEVHASTQCTTHNSGQIEFLSSLGARRVNLSRELNLEQIRAITAKAHALGVATEVFVHGAYCISFSGQCYMSSFMGGQSGNRGLCFQPCRRRYGTERGGEKTYRLSLKDNNAYTEALSLIDAGVDALKIEGRRKNFFYVYSIVSAWRELFARLDAGERSIDTDERLYRVFNRGFHSGYLKDSIDRSFFIDTPLDQSLTFLGRVRSYTAATRVLTLDEPFSAERDMQLEIYTPGNFFICTAVCEEKTGPSSVRIRIENELKGKIEKGQLVAVNPFYALMPKVKAEIGRMVAEKIPVQVTVSGAPGRPLSAAFRSQGKAYTAESSLPLAFADKNPLTLDTIKRQFGKMGGTAFTLSSVETDDLSPDCFLPIGELNEMRRDALEHLKPYSSSLSNIHIPLIETEAAVQSDFSVILSNRADAQAFLNKGVRVFLEVLRPSDMPDDGSVPFLPAIVHERDLHAFISAARGKGVKEAVCSNTGLGLLLSREGIRWISGPYSNVTNTYACAALRERGMAAGVFLSNELNGNQLEEIAIPRGMDSYLIVFGPILLMTTKQCLAHGDVPCRKARCDENCFHSCEYSRTWFDERELPFHIVKRSSSYTQIFNDPILSIPQAVRRFWGRFSSFVLDLRDLPFYNLTPREKEVIFQYYRSLPESKPATDESVRDFVRDVVPSVTKGNYERGLS
ncbi:MAG TPA: U32 family peptidase [Spirochaetia bacterium]|nr:U32 family peptidase [Spirochaetia bacterium]